MPHPSPSTPTALPPPVAAPHLELNERRFRAFLTASADVIYRMNADWTELQYLQGREFIADSAHPNRSWMDWMDQYIHPDDRQLVCASIQQAIRSRSNFELEHRVIKADGNLGWTWSRAVPIIDPDGSIVEWFGVARDVSENHLAKASLDRRVTQAEQEQRLYRTIMSSTPDLIYVFNLEHRFIYANAALLTMWGKQWDEANGKNCLELGYEPWHAAMHDREIEQVIASKQPIRGEVPFTGVQGRRIYEYIFVPVFGVHGEVEAIAGTTRDVTDRKQAEDAMRVASQRKDEFLALLAHELRNPLAALASASQLLAKPSQKPEVVALAREGLQRQVHHMSHLLDDLLDMARITHGRVHLRTERIDLRGVIDAAIQTVTAQIEAKSHTLIVNVPQRPLFVQGDPVRLSQIVGNLLSNSAKYTNPGGTIEISLTHTANSASLAVKDNGIGISSELLPRVFEMFAQADKASNHGGLGIGLSLVKGLAELHRGSAEARSPGEGKGSEFVVQLPLLADQSEHPSRDASSAALADRPKLRILVADDNAESATNWAMLLQQDGHEVRAVFDGRSALQEFERFHPHVALLDVGMPHLNGYELARRLRSTDWGAKITLIAITGWGQARDRSLAAEAGFDHHFTKPASFEDVHKAIAATRIAAR